MDSATVRAAPSYSRVRSHLLWNVVLNACPITVGVTIYFDFMLCHLHPPNISNYNFFMRLFLAVVPLLLSYAAYLLISKKTASISLLSVILVLTMVVFLMKAFYAFYMVYLAFRVNIYDPSCSLQDDELVAEPFPRNNVSSHDEWKEETNMYVIKYGVCAPFLLLYGAFTFYSVFILAKYQLEIKRSCIQRVTLHPTLPSQRLVVVSTPIKDPSLDSKALALLFTNVYLNIMVLIIGITHHFMPMQDHDTWNIVDYDFYSSLSLTVILLSICIITSVMSIKKSIPNRWLSAALILTIIVFFVDIFYTIYWAFKVNISELLPIDEDEKPITGMSRNGTKDDPSIKERDKILKYVGFTTPLLIYAAFNLYSVFIFHKYRLEVKEDPVQDSTPAQPSQRVAYHRQSRVSPPSINDPSYSQTTSNLYPSIPPQNNISVYPNLPSQSIVAI